jgi:hypothetical protein
VGSTAPFAGPKQLLSYFCRYTHRVAISNGRLVALDDKGVTFKWKDYRLEGRERYGLMTLDTHEFIRRFLMHVLPHGFHRIRYYGLLTSPTRANNIARIRELLAVPLLPIDAIKAATTKPEEPQASEHKAAPRLRGGSLVSLIARWCMERLALARPWKGWRSWAPVDFKTDGGIGVMSCHVMHGAGRRTVGEIGAVARLQ